jgi:hypothetical protein
VITDWPCVIVPGPLALPILVAGLPVLGAEEILPAKFRLAMGWEVPQGARGRGGRGRRPSSTRSNHAPNAASGHCADVPGPFVPPPRANVVCASLEVTGYIRTLDSRPAAGAVGRPAVRAAGGVVPV